MRLIGGNLFHQARDRKEVLDRRQPIDHREGDVKHTLNGRQPISLFSCIYFQ